MAWPAGYIGATPAGARTDTKLANTFERDVDSKLWAALMAKSPILDKLARPQLKNFKFEWENDVAPARTFAGHGTPGDFITSAGTGTTLEMAATNLFVEAGAIIRNVSRATTVGSYGQDELIEVVANDGDTLTVVRDAGRQAAGTGSSAHVTGDTFEVIYTPKEEGSSAGANRYTDVVLAENYANSVDFFLTVTGDQAQMRRIVAGDTIDNQFQKNLLNLQNQLEGMFFYGCLNNGANAGSIAYVKRTKGLDAWVGASGGNYDITTKDVTPEALDGLFAQIVEDKSDPSDPYVIACHPQNARKVSQFGIDKVRTTNEVTKWGRHIDTFKSDLGIEAEVIWSLNISKSDLFIIDMAKVELPMWRAFEKAEWSYGDDGVDAWRQCYLGAFGVKVVDGLYSHAKLGLLPWA